MKFEMAFSLIISAAAFLFAMAKYRSAFPTVKMVENKSKDYNKSYSIKFTCGNVSNQFLVQNYKLFKRKHLLYREEIPYRFHLINLNFLVISALEIQLNSAIQLDNGRYKFIFYTDRTPKKLKLKFKMPIYNVPKLTK